MYNKDLKEYILLKNRVPVDVCESIMAQSASQEWQPHPWNDKHRDYRGEVWPDNPSSTSLAADTVILDYVNPVLKSYCRLYSIPGVDTVGVWKVNRYHVGQCMRSHVDHIYTINKQAAGIPVLSIVVNLNSDYSGGEFEFWNKWAPKLTQGDIMIFPSNFLYPHRVTAVTAGTRYSAVAWAW